MRNLNNAISRFGRQVPVYEETASGSEDSFGQKQLSWSKTGEILAARSYQNRNTTMNSSNGERHRDRPVFFFPSEESPAAGNRIKYEGVWYELDATTEHQTHTVAPGSEVIDENFSPE